MKSTITPSHLQKAGELLILLIDPPGCHDQTFNRKIALIPELW